MKTYEAKNARIELEASQWLARLANADPAVRTPKRDAELTVWLRESPEHVRAFLQASDAFYRLDGLTPQVAEKIRGLAREDGGNVSRLPVTPRLSRGVMGRRGWVMGGIALLAACVLLSVWRPGLHTRSHGTTVGEQRTVKLDDGSIVHLNTRSRITVRFSDSLREVSLLDGEALFTVERDTKRPFVVRTGDTAVQALGTAFNVYRHDETVQVAVVEGTVQVSATPPASADRAGSTLGAHRIVLRAGEGAKVVMGQVAREARADVGDAIAWRERRLVFKDTPLGEVVGEFNRYNTSQVRIEGEALRSKPLTGVFSADHPQSLILYLSEFGELAVTREGENWVVRSR